MADIEYLKSLQAVRERAQLVLQAACKDELSHFHYNAAKMSTVAEFVTGIITRDFGPDKFDRIPPHGRWQHFDIGNIPRVGRLVDQWQDTGCDKLEVTRRLVDLFFVSVLLDAGAGDVWKFTEPGTGKAYGRSEGIAVASMYMMKAGAFTSHTDNLLRVDGHGLDALTTDIFRKHFQISAENPILSDKSRVSLLNSVGSSLLALPKFFGPDGRPGQLVDYLLRTRNGSDPLDFDVLWSVLQELLLPAWPKDRTQVAGVPVGDAWPLQVLERVNTHQPGRSEALRIQPFHKLTQWLAYSITVPFLRVLSLEWKNVERATGLPEYRNGGLFIDLGVLKLKDQTLKHGLESSNQQIPSFPASSDVIVEWRAMTVALLDELHKLVSERLGRQGIKLSLPQMLEAGTWKGGRELAAQLRPHSKSSPILIQGDGTLF
ncbi:hypothetical protein ASPVEDRAFT_47925 [Aspergillus versicolor CBS 583.65]|uniref:DUF1688 domain-containing protein n=1 Tax=Aspergillus versicolor CBS 583.65 TaxID=1036611 RepID=A0A1L9Q4U5_ASPVE|nr:uncharacterized protein ASPVEDRAFT_47925 [Aspergillus versicolor CBS 583.65]OJJ08752.1 hypothetical protein ASPVEDRAFT_47925 [Aspergillus versicolor CBS 583.65]